MFVEHLGLQDFRNYETAEVSLARGANVFVGRNGQGKTNLAESLAYLATLGSHRVSQDAPLVREGKDAAFVRARLAHGERRVTLDLQINKQGANKARVNGAPVKPAELPRYAHVVLFAPEDLQIVRGDPSARRKFADQMLIQRRPRMAGIIADYERVLKQRNALLKSARSRGVKGEGLSTLDVWDDKLITLGSQLIDARLAFAAEMAAPVAAAYTAIAGADHSPTLSWVLSITGADPEENETSTAGAESGTTAEQFRAALAAKRGSELERGLTLVGPHRDDLLLTVRGLPVKGYASHGESWSVALALRLASAELLREELSAGDPILILDDVFAELDAQRRTRLADLAAGYEQVIVTSAVEEDVPTQLRAHVVRVQSGQIIAIEPRETPETSEPRETPKTPEPRRTPEEDEPF
ncbi:DNA replication/repair protein RecF [Microbacterium mitrae]|uniref:DNA replication and repair protein RecF n=1 Tax=Microbacterium mitrae TaxID=664640 RepID=A0A5C8HNH1_9MICO|nr:DNA replication/repair protein RecF [Microbacterium mitrae]TXK03453.1 DNA replication/repair protein RecF [Microbacterium mitrae]